MKETFFKTPIGKLRLIAKDGALVGIYWPGHKPAPKIAATPGDDPCFELVRQQLGEWFKGDRATFDLPLAPDGTDFQRRVWRELALIPFGATRSYGEVAIRLGLPTASRAVATANARNPLSIVVPCHRVISSDGSLAGYAGGVAAKKWLLDHERVILNP